MSSGTLVDVPADLLAVNDPAIFEAEVVARFKTAAQEDRQALLEKLQEYMKSEKARERMVKEAQKGLDAIRVIREAFPRVTDLLSKIDAKEFIGKDGKPIKKFEPEWNDYRKTFNDNLLKTEGLAIAASASIDSFVKGVLPLLDKKGMEFAIKSQNIEDFIENTHSMEKSICVVDDLIKSYKDLSAKITVFRNYFIEIMEQVGQRLDVDIKNVEADIARIDERIAHHKDNAKNLGIVAGVSGVIGIAAGIGACFFATGVLAPIAIICIGTAVIFGVSAADEWFNKAKELQKQRDEKRKKLDELTAKRGHYQQLEPSINLATRDMGTISEKLTTLSSVFNFIRQDALKVKFHLENASKPGQQEDMTKAELELTAQSYANLQVILETFAAGWEEANHIAYIATYTPVNLYHHLQLALAMASGVQVNDACLQVYQELKLGKKHRYMVCTLNKDNTEIIVERTGPRGGDAQADYEAFVDTLPETECRWAIYDFEYEKGDAGKRNKLLFISWSPDTAKIKAKMLAASSKDALRRSLVGIAIEIQGTDSSEVEYASVMDKVNKGA